MRGAVRGSGSDPHLRRWMMFVDGENLTIRAQNFSRDKSFKLQENSYFMHDAFVWIPHLQGTQQTIKLLGAPLGLQVHAIRAFYYTSVFGDDVKLKTAQEKLHEIGFTPRVFKKPTKDRKSKGVDIALATDVLSNAYNDNFDVVVLVAGDGDYKPLVEEVKHLGKVVYLSFFLEKNCGLSDELRLVSDGCFDLAEQFIQSWQAHYPT